MDEFEEVASNTCWTMTPPGEGNANARKRIAIARVVSRVYRAANDAIRAEMLRHLLRPLGVLGLVAVASGAFARLVRSDGVVKYPISAKDIVSYSGEQIRELTLFVHEVNPDALQPLVEQLAQNPMSVAALSTAALVLLHRSSRRRFAGSSKTVSSAVPMKANWVQMNSMSPQIGDKTDSAAGLSDVHGRRDRSPA